MLPALRRSGGGVAARRWWGCVVVWVEALRIGSGQANRSARTSTVFNATGWAVGAPATDSCSRCDVLFGLDGVGVVAVERDDGLLRVVVQTLWALMGCPDLWGGGLEPGMTHPGPARRARGGPRGDRVVVSAGGRAWTRVARGAFSELLPTLVAPGEVPDDSGDRLGGRVAARRVRHDRWPGTPPGGGVVDVVAGGQAAT